MRSIKDFATVLLEGDVQNWINRKKSSFPFLLTVAAFRSCFFYFVNCNHLPQYFRKNVCCGSQSRTSASLLVPLARQDFAQNRPTNCGAQNCNGPNFAAPFFAITFFFGMGVLEDKRMSECWTEFVKKFPTVYLVRNVFTI